MTATHPPGEPAKNLREMVRQFFCRHEFRLGEQSYTGIPVPPVPQNFEAAMEHFMSLPSHPSHTQRIQWPCCKCGKVFFAHCGLDVLSKHGRLAALNSPTP